LDGLGIDLGTANTVVWHAERGVVVNEPSMMVFRAGKRGRLRLLATGGDARALVGRTPREFTVIRPLEDGVVADLEMARTFLRSILRQAHVRWWERRRLSVVVGVPVGATALERRALVEAAVEAGIGKVRLIAEPVAGALGCGLDPLEPRTHVVVDIGGGTSEVTAFSFGGELTSRSCRQAGDEMTLAVYRHFREEHQLVVGELAAEDIKIRASSEASPVLVVEGIDAATGRGRKITVGAEEIVDALRRVVDGIVETLAGCLEDLPPQSVSDVMAEGILAIGGGSLTLGFNKRLEDAFGFSVRMADRPLTCVAEGAAACLSRPEVLSAYAL
jgi:rod shape-determining protein MreB